LLVLGKQVVRVDREWNCPVEVFDISDVQTFGFGTKVYVNVALVNHLAYQMVMNCFNRVSYLLIIYETAPV
jgi:hypothetical protein